MDVTQSSPYQCSGFGCALLNKDTKLHLTIILNMSKPRSFLPEVLCRRCGSSSTAGLCTILLPEPGTRSRRRSWCCAPQGCRCWRAACSRFSWGPRAPSPSQTRVIFYTQHRHVPEENPRFSMYQEFIEIYWRWQNSIDNFPQPTAGGRIQIWNIFSLPLPIVSLELQPSTLDYSVFETLARVDTLITSLLRKY